MKFLVTGGSGFVGSYLVKHLLKEGYDVIVIDNLHDNNLENIKGIIPEIRMVKASILEYEKLKDVSRSVDGIFHQAALTSVPESFTKESDYYAVNVTGTENIFKIAQELGIKVVFASSAAVYGNTTTIPITESYERKPVNPYGETKVLAEKLAEKYAKMGTKIIGLRYFNVYGEGQNSVYAGVITNFLKKILEKKSPVIYGDGRQVRDFVYVDDVAQANLLAMKTNLDHAIINIGSGTATSIDELANLIIRISGLSLKPVYEKAREGDIVSSQADISLAMKLLNWKPATKLEKWLQNIISKSRSFD